MSEVSSSIKQLVDRTMVCLDKIANAISEESATKNQAVDELLKIEGLSIVQIMKAGKAIIDDSYMTTIFLSLPDEKKREMVEEVLKS